MGFDALGQGLDALAISGRGEQDRGLPTLVIARAGEAQGRLEFTPCALGEGTRVGLVDHEEIGQFEDTGLHELQGVAGAGLGDEDQGVHEPGDLAFGLPDPHGLDEDPLEDRREHCRARVGGIGQATQTIPGRHGAQEDTAFPGAPGQAHAVAQQGASGALARGIHRDDPDSRRVVAEALYQSVEQGGFARPRRPGDPDPVGGAGGEGGLRVGALAGQAIEQFEGGLAFFAPAIVDQVERLGNRPAITRGQAFEQALDELGRARFHEAASPTMSTTSAMIRVRSKSLGV